MGGQSASSADVPGKPTAGYFCGADPASAGPFEQWRFGARAASALFRQARRHDDTWDIDFIHGIERFERKVLFLAGSCNTITGEAQQRRHMRGFPNAELIVIEGSGHRMFSEKPTESLAAVRHYFEEEQGSSDVEEGALDHLQQQRRFDFGARGPPLGTAERLRKLLDTPILSSGNPYQRRDASRTAARIARVSKGFPTH